MKKPHLLLLGIGLSFLEFAHADTISSSGQMSQSVTQSGAKQETISSHQQGKPSKVVKPAQATPVPVVVVPASPGQTTPGAPAGK